MGRRLTVRPLGSLTDEIPTFGRDWRTEPPCCGPQMEPNSADHKPAVEFSCSGSRGHGGRGCPPDMQSETASWQRTAVRLVKMVESMLRTRSFQIGRSIDGDARPSWESFPMSVAPFAAAS